MNKQNTYIFKDRNGINRSEQTKWTRIFNLITT